LKPLHSLAFAVSILMGTAIAQSAANSGEILGQIFDASSAAVQGARVTIRNQGTNFSRTTVTDKAGRFAVANVPLGPYEVEIRAAGFATNRQQVFVTLGSSVSATFRLAIAARTESVTVNAQNPGIEPARTAPKSILTEKQLADLPSNGRRVQNNVIETPAALIEPECRGFSISGQKGIYSNVNIDGGDYNSTWGCGIRGRSESAPNFSLEALAELQVIRNTFSAEFGRSTGGVINLSTKSGTNNFHGSGFYLVRDSSLAMDDAFGRSDVSRIQQFGGSFGGPMAQDRTFLFVAPEFQYGSKPVNVLYSVLDSQNLRGTPGAQALLAVAPEQELSAISNSQSVISRVDHRISDRNSLLARFDFTRAIQINNPGATNLSTGIGVAAQTGSTTNVALTSQFILPDTNYTAIAQLTSTPSGTHVNELRFQFSRELRPRSTEGSGPQVTVQNAGSTIAQYGPPAALSSFGGLTYASTDDRYQFVDNFSFVTGAHTTKIGFDYIRIAGNLLFNGGDNGLYLFPSLTAFLARQPSQYQQFTGTGALNLTMHEPAAFIQDEWRIRSGLTLTAGLRYEAQLNPNYLAATAPQRRPAAAHSIPNDTSMFAPRLGLAWDIGNHGKTVIRAGGGLFYAPTFLSLFAQSILFNGGNPETGLTVKVTNPAQLASAFQSIGINLASAPLNNLPVFTPAQAAQALPASSNNVFYMDPNFTNPRSTQAQLGVEHEFAPSISLSESFSYINTVHIARQLDTNLGTPVLDATGREIFSNPRPDPQFGVMQITQASSRALYRGLTTSFTVRRRRFTLDANYTLAWNFSGDDSERGISSIRYDNVLNLNNEYSYSDIDERHQFVADSIFELPFGFELGATSRLTSGRPFTALAGTDLNQDQQNTDRPVINGQVLERNTFRNTGFKDVSMRVQRNFRLPNEKGTVSLSGEVFNVFNFANVQIGASNMVYGPGSVLQNGLIVQPAAFSTFAQLKDSQGHYLQSNTAGDALQAQLGIRFRF
jgi:hypothetical protein